MVSIEVICDECDHYQDVEVSSDMINMGLIKAYIREFLFNEGEILEFIKDIDFNTLSNTEKEGILNHIKGELE